MSIKKNPNKKLIENLEELANEKLTLGSLLKSIRLGEEQTQEIFAAKLGITKQSLCDIEKSRRFVSPKLAAKYADLLGYSEKTFVRLCLQDLLDRDGFDFIVSIEAA